jgi:diguanylate cyclase (GGDEF)-like protein/putative nucleotidyltransferase with HDIG domain
MILIVKEKPSMKRLHLKKPIVITSLSIITFILLSSSIGSLIIVWQMNDQANEAVHIEDLYQQAHYLARSEAAVADEYYLNPGDDSKDNYDASANALDTIFYTLAQQGDTYDQTLVNSLLQAQKFYILRTYQFFYMVDIGDRRARSFYNNQVDPLSSSLNTRLQAELNQDHQESIQRATLLQTTERVVAISLAMVFFCSILLVVAGSNMLRRYQRELVQIRQVEWKQMEQLARNDPLTGLPNHRVTIEYLERETASCQYLQQSCTLMFVDLDHFKQINDQWGHQTGDDVLCEAGRRLQAHLRPKDVVGRYGGEEFVVILHQTDLAQAEQIAERLRAALADHPCLIQAEDDTVPPKELVITASIGIAVFQHHGTTATALLEAADSAMYQAKHSGRNRVCIASGLSSTMQVSLGDDEQTSTGETMTLHALTTAAHTHDDETTTHAHRLVKLAGATAQRLQCSPEECHLIQLAALLHDIGKIGIPDTILHKPGPLTSDEWKVMRQHPVLGQQMLKQVGGIFEELSRIVVAHHEHWDGQGYPFALIGQAIPLGARILSVVDSYDAMTSLRIYRQPLSEDDARIELLRCTGSQFDPQVVAAFLAELDAENALEISKEVITSTGA